MKITAKSGLPVNNKLFIGSLILSRTEIIPKAVNGKLANLDAVELARKGPEEWQKWHEQNSVDLVEFNKSDFSTEPISFANFKFTTKTEFLEVNFQNADFTNAIFEDEVLFCEVNFTTSNLNGDSLFDEAIFRGKSTVFDQCKFSDGGTSFRKVWFSSDLTLIQTGRFERRVTFEKATFKGEQIYIIENVFKGEVKFQDCEFLSKNTNLRDNKFRYANFEGSKFKGIVNLTSCKYFSAANFNKTKFDDNVNFGSSNFAKADFDDVTFSGLTTFNKSNFSGPAKFTTAEFIKSANFMYCTFSEVPDFRQTKFSTHVNLHGVDIDFRKSKGQSRKFLTETALPEDASKYRRLKELAAMAADHSGALDFLAGELKSKRSEDVGKLEILLIFLYGFFSDYGRSISRPFIASLVLLFFFGAIFGLNLNGDSCCDFKFSDGLVYSMSILTLVLPSSRIAFEEARSALFSDIVPFYINLLSTIEGIFGLIFLFLLGLAIRNKLRI